MSKMHDEAINHSVHVLSWLGEDKTVSLSKDVVRLMLIAAFEDGWSSKGLHDLREKFENDEVKTGVPYETFRKDQ